MDKLRNQYLLIADPLLQKRKRQMSDYGLTEDHASNSALCQNTEPLSQKNGSNVKISPLEPFKDKEDFRDNSSEILCQNR